MSDIKLICNPIDLYVANGWCKNLAQIFWDQNVLNQNNASYFRQYIDYIESSIHFQCVIMARYDWGLLFIDTCDASDWEIENIEEPHIYLKLQYNPSFNYKNNVKPFTYTTHNPIIFNANIDYYRKIYTEQKKTNLVYGRWIGVSLQRYNLCKKMRSVGIFNGGEYCTTKKGEGYDDHESEGLLDPIKPRERMAWEEYFKYQSLAMSTIDAAGFGDFTHRMIESFGIGIPVIRPKLTNETEDLLIPDEHYLDCGINGEYLEECTAKICDNNTRNRLIANGLEWYHNNATPTAIYNLLLRTINNKKKYNHIYKLNRFGEDWFSYPELYKEMVRKFDSNSHFVEVGSWKGKSSSFMAVEIANSNKEIKFDCVDTWNGSPEHGDCFKNNDLLYDLFISNMKTLKDYYTPIRTTSIEAAKLYNDKSLDFIFIDANHSYESVKEDIAAWLPKLKNGGVLAGHDYVEMSWPGVFKAVNETLGQDNIVAKYDCWIYQTKN